MITQPKPWTQNLLHILLDILYILCGIYGLSDLSRLSWITEAMTDQTQARRGQPNRVLCSQGTASFLQWQTKIYIAVNDRHQGGRARTDISEEATDCLQWYLSIWFPTPKQKCRLKSPKTKGTTKKTFVKPELCLLVVEIFGAPFINND